MNMSNNTWVNFPQNEHFDFMIMTVKSPTEPHSLTMPSVVTLWTLPKL